MIASLFHYWMDTAMMWTGNPLSRGSVVGLALLGWPTAMSYSLLFWLDQKKRKQWKRRVLSITVMLCCLVPLQWLIQLHVSALYDLEKLTVLTSIVFLFAVGCLIYCRPISKWRKRQREKR